MVKVQEKYFKTKYWPTDMLLNGNATIYFKSTLQLQFINNKNYSSIIVDFRTGLRKRKNKNNYEKIATHWFTVISLLLKRRREHVIETALFSIRSLQTR
jgi:hypothetical protein